jgi:hypothetical protein
MRLFNPFRRREEPERFYPEKHEDITKELPKVERKHSTGRVIRVDKKPTYDITRHHKGGYVTKTMPKDLRRIKEAQEKIDEVSE